MTFHVNHDSISCGRKRRNPAILGDWSNGMTRVSKTFSGSSIHTNDFLSVRNAVFIRFFEVQKIKRKKLLKKLLNQKGELSGEALNQQLLLYNILDKTQIGYIQ